MQGHPTLIESYRVKERVYKRKNGEAVSKSRITGEMPEAFSDITVRMVIDS